MTRLDGGMKLLGRRIGPRASAVVAALLGGWAVAALAPRDFITGTFKDDAQYAVLAKAIRERHTYRGLEFPGRPPEVKFPPLWPAILALAWKPGAGGAENLQRLRWINLALVGPLASLLAVAGMAVFGLSPPLSAVVALAGVAAPTVMSWWTAPLSEPLCLALLVLGVVLAERGRKRGAAVALAAGVYVRSVAAPFLLALVMVEAWKRGWRRAVQPTAIGLAILLPWLAWVTLNAHAVPPVLVKANFGSYPAFYRFCLAADPATMLLIVPWVNAPLIVQTLGRSLLGWQWAAKLVELALGAVAVALVVRAGRTRPVFWMGLALYALTVLFWPFPEEDRFLGSIWPLLLLAVLAGLPWPRARWGVAAVLALIAVVGFAQGRGVAQHRQGSRSTLALEDSVRGRIPAGSVVATDNPPLFYLRSGDPAALSWAERSYRWYREGFWAAAWGLGDDLWDIVRTQRPDYLLVGRSGAEGRYAAGSLMRQCPGVLEQVWSTPGGEYLFKVHGDVPCSPVRTPK